MKRRSFFAAVTALFAVPAVLKASKKDVNPFNVEVLKERKRQLDSIPKDPMVGEGELYVMDRSICIVSMCSSPRIGDIIATTKTDRLFVKNRIEVHDGLYHFLCTELHSPKFICNRPVIMIDGKYVQYKSMVNNRPHWKIKFRPCASVFKEGGV